MAKKQVKYDFVPKAIKGKRFKDDGTRAEILSQVADFVVESILAEVAVSKSPVTGKKFPKLSEKYTAFKRGELGGRVKGKAKRDDSNLELTGELLDSLTATVINGNKIRVTVPEDQQGKADNHNKFTKKAKKTKVPRRAFIPREGERFVTKIEKGADAIVEALIEDAEQTDD